MKRACNNLLFLDLEARVEDREDGESEDAEDEYGVSTSIILPDEELANNWFLDDFLEDRPVDDEYIPWTRFENGDPKDDSNGWGDIFNHPA